MYLYILKIWEWIWLVFKALFKISVSIIVVIICSFVFILASPILLFRLFVTLLSSFRSDLHGIIDVHSSILAIGDNHGNPVMPIVSSLVFKGNLNIKDSRRLVKKKVIDAKTIDGQLKNVKLKQYPYQWMGFMFWKWEDNFDLSEHVYYYQPKNKNSTVSKEEILKLESELMINSFTNKKSPWEIMVIKDVEWETSGEHSMVMFRFHHCLCDGLSFMKNISLPLSSSDGAKLEQFMATPAKSPKHNALQQFFTTVKMLMLVPCEFLKNIVDIQRPHDWRNSGCKFERKYVASLSERIPMKLLKEIKIIHNVEITSVIFSGFTAGIREAMLNMNGKVPNYIQCLIPIPIPGHPECLTNHFSVVHLRLPVGEPDPVKRLKMIQESLDDWKKNLLPLAFYYFSSFVGALFPSLIRLSSNKIVPTVIGSSFPGPKHKYYILDHHEAVDIYFSIGPSFDSSPVLVTSMSNGDNVRMRISMTTSVLESQTDIEDIQKAIETEYILLKQHCAKPKHED